MKKIKEQTSSSQPSTFKRSMKTFFSGTRSSLDNFGRAILVPVTVIPLLALIGAIGYAMQAIATQVGTYEGGSNLLLTQSKILE